MNKYKIILVSGFIRSGKTTFTNLLLELDNYKTLCPESFAYELKQDLKPLVSNMGIDIFRPTEEQKKIVRNLMIAYGCAWREIDPNHWVKMVDEKINKMPAHWVPILDDARFINECDYFIKKYGRDKVLIVEIIRPDGPTPPKEELENQPKISAIADYSLTWHSDPTSVSLRPIVADFYQRFST